MIKYNSNAFFNRNKNKSYAIRATWWGCPCLLCHMKCKDKLTLVGVLFAKELKLKGLVVVSVWAYGNSESIKPILAGWRGPKE